MYEENVLFTQELLKEKERKRKREKEIFILNFDIQHVPYFVSYLCSVF